MAEQVLFFQPRPVDEDATITIMYDYKHTNGQGERRRRNCTGLDNATKAATALARDKAVRDLTVWDGARRIFIEGV